MYSRTGYTLLHFYGPVRPFLYLSMLLFRPETHDVLHSVIRPERNTPFPLLLLYTPTKRRNAGVYRMN